MQSFCSFTHLPSLIPIQPTLPPTYCSILCAFLFLNTDSPLIRPRLQIPRLTGLNHVGCRWRPPFVLFLTLILPKSLPHLHPASSISFFPFFRLQFPYYPAIHPSSSALRRRVVVGLTHLSLPTFLTSVD